ncbi:MAG: hypothetical protein AB1814_19375 [Thermodesulfobacteriota bacterium]
MLEAMALLLAAAAFLALALLALVFYIAAPGLFGAVVAVWCVVGLLLNRWALAPAREKGSSVNL